MTVPGGFAATLPGPSGLSMDLVALPRLNACFSCSVSPRRQGPKKESGLVVRLLRAWFPQIPIPQSRPRSMQGRST